MTAQDDRLDPRAAELIRDLQLSPHPEGGFYREVFRSAATVQPADRRPARSALTTIYFLLSHGTRSRWHRVDSDEVWHLYEGGPIELFVAPPDVATLRRIVLGPALASDGPMFTVPAGWWQAARPIGTYALAGCTVGPGFDFGDFVLVDQVPDVQARLRRLDPAALDFM